MKLLVDNNDDDYDRWLDSTVRLILSIYIILLSDLIHFLDIRIPIFRVLNLLKFSWKYEMIKN